MYGSGFKTIHLPSHTSLHIPLPTPFTYTSCLHLLPIYPSPIPPHLNHSPTLPYLHLLPTPPHLYPLTYTPSSTPPLPLTIAGIASPKLEVIKFVYPEHGTVFSPGVMRDKQLSITRQDLHQGRARTGAWYMGHCGSTQRSFQRIQVSIDLEEATG